MGEKRVSNGRLGSVSLSVFKGMLKSEVLYPAANADGTAPSYGGITRTKRYYYDYRGRITCSNRELDGVPLRSLTYEYDELGRLSQKIMGDGPDHIGYAAFDYDIHGWTTDIAAYNNWDSDLVFSETLRYAAPQKGGSTARYDGGISEIAFSAPNASGTVVTDTYGYSYDALKRLTDAAHYSGSATSQNLLKTEKGITYDRNGNITGLDRYGVAGLSEMLSFTHVGNQLADSRQGLQFCCDFADLPSKTEGILKNKDYIKPLQ